MPGSSGAVTRQARAPLPDMSWTRMDLYGSGDVAQAPDVVFSVGPLDGLLAWLSHPAPARPRDRLQFHQCRYQAGFAGPRRTGIKAAQLRRSEEALVTHCDARGIGWTILRPTLVWGCGMDQNLSRIAALVRRWRVLPLPRDAHGLRQPVHAQDLAICAWRAAGTDQSLGKRYDLPGGEQVSYTEMVRRTVRCLAPRGYLLRLPAWLFQLAAGLVSRLGVMFGLTSGMLERLRQDLVFSAAEAERDLNWTPRPFQPRAEHFQRPDRTLLLQCSTKSRRPPYAAALLSDKCAPYDTGCVALTPVAEGIHDHAVQDHSYLGAVHAAACSLWRLQQQRSRRADGAVQQQRWIAGHWRTDSPV